MSQQGYIGRNPGDGRTIVNRQTSHVTTGVQTSFTMTSGYDIGYLDVYLNGIKQTETLDYTASDGSTISFSPSFAPMNGDVLEFVAFETLNITNIKSARRNFTVGQDLDVSGKVTIGSSLTVASDLVVNGTFTTINTEILDVEDKTVGIASTSSPSNTTADGAGIVIYGGSDGDKSLTWNSTKSNFVLVGGGVSIGTGVTISTPAANVLAFSVNSAEKARFNNFGAFTVGYEGEAWKESVYVGVLQAGSGAWIGQTPGAGARAEWVNNAYYDSVNTRWEYIAADEANRIYLENGELHLQSAASGSADGAITWNEKLAMTVGGDFKIGPNAGIGITISSSGNVDSIGIVTASSFDGNLNASQLASGTVPTARLGSGTASSSTFLRGDSTFAVVNTDLVADTSPQLGGTLDANGNNIEIDDGNFLKFGGTGLTIRTNANNAYITEGTSGKLEISASNLQLSNAASDKTYAYFTDGGAAALYHNGTSMFETTADGATLQKGLTVRGIEGGEAQIRIEADEADNASDRFRLVASDSAGFNIQSYDGSQYDNLFSGYMNGTVELYYNNVKKLDTISTGVRIHGDEGGTAQLHFLADQGDDNADYWRIIGETSGSILNFQNYNSGNWENNIRLTGDAGCELYWNNGVKLATSNGGVTVTGRVTTDDLTVERSSGNLSAMFTATNGLGTLEIGGSTGAFIDLKMPTSDDFDFRLGTGGSGGYMNVPSGQSIAVTGHFNPAASNSYQLGTNSYKWSEVHSPKFVHRYGNSGGTGMNEQESIWIGGGLNFFHDNETLSTNSYTHGFANSRSYAMFRIKNSGGAAIYAESGSISSGSDYRMKENITELTGGINTLKNLKPCTFTIRESFNPVAYAANEVHHGFIAHEVQEAIPNISNIVSGTKDAVQTTEADKGKPDYQGIDYGHLTPILASAIKELITKVETLETENTALKARVTTLEGS